MGAETRGLGWRALALRDGPAFVSPRGNSQHDAADCAAQSRPDDRVGEPVRAEIQQGENDDRDCCTDR